VQNMKRATSLLVISLLASLAAAQSKNESIDPRGSPKPPAEWDFSEKKDEMDGRRTQATGQDSSRITRTWLNEQTRPSIVVLCKESRQYSQEERKQLGKRSFEEVSKNTISIVIMRTGPLETTGSSFQLGHRKSMFGRFKFEDGIVHPSWWSATDDAFLLGDGYETTGGKRGEGRTWEATDFLRELLKHKTLLIEFTGYRSGDQLAEFDLTGLREAMKKMDLCPGRE
jgi:hypothetical protein